MTEPQFLFGVVMVVVNAAVTWATVRTQVAWLRRDVDELRAFMLGRKSVQ